MCASRVSINKTDLINLTSLTLKEAAAGALVETSPSGCAERDPRMECAAGETTGTSGADAGHGFGD